MPTRMAHPRQEVYEVQMAIVNFYYVDMFIGKYTPLSIEVKMLIFL